ncbi:MAG: glutathione S-transferase [Alphaproteobacteria bacterium]|nr:MAG: glutathione S-transferase [Alphaproteobacteria bacterium]
MLTLFHAPQSRSSRIVWLVEELELDCPVRYCQIAVRNGQTVGEADPANPHPDGKVPALRHDDAVITESAAIALYLTDLHPEANLGAPLGSAERGALLTWICWAVGELEPAIWSKMTGEADRDPLAKARYEAAVFRLLEALWVGPYLMGERFTAADVMVGSILGWARSCLPESPLLDDYAERLAQRPAHVRADARDAAPAIANAA